MRGIKAVIVIALILVAGTVLALGNKGAEIRQKQRADGDALTGSAKQVQETEESDVTANQSVVFYGSIGMGYVAILALFIICVLKIPGKKRLAVLLVGLLTCNLLVGCAGSNYQFGDVSKAIYKVADENGLIDKAKEELKDPENQKKIAKAIEKAIKSYLNKKDD